MELLRFLRFTIFGTASHIFVKKFAKAGAGSPSGLTTSLVVMKTKYKNLRIFNQWRFALVVANSRAYIKDVLMQVLSDAHVS